MIMVVAEKKKSADDNMAEIFKVVSDVSGTVDSLSRRKTALDSTIRTNLVELKTLLNDLEDQTRRYSKKNSFSKWANATKNDVHDDSFALARTNCTDNSPRPPPLAAAPYAG